jgi:hypothetical protein
VPGGPKIKTSLLNEPLGRELETLFKEQAQLSTTTCNNDDGAALAKWLAETNSARHRLSVKGTEN